MTMMPRPLLCTLLAAGLMLPSVLTAPADAALTINAGTANTSGSATATDGSVQSLDSFSETGGLVSGGGLQTVSTLGGTNVLSADDGNDDNGRVVSLLSEGNPDVQAVPAVNFLSATGSASLEYDLISGDPQEATVLGDATSDATIDFTIDTGFLATVSATVSDDALLNGTAASGAASLVFDPAGSNQSIFDLDTEGGSDFFSQTRFLEAGDYTLTADAAASVSTDAPPGSGISISGDWTVFIQPIPSPPAMLAGMLLFAVIGWRRRRGGLA